MAAAPPRFAAAAAAILAHPRVSDAAASIGVPVRTFVRWRSLPGFKAAMNEERRRVMAEATDHLRSSSVVAVQVLRSIMSDTDAPPAVRVQAASCVLSNAYKAIEISDVSERLDALENATDATNRN